MTSSPEMIDTTAHAPSTRKMAPLVAAALGFLLVYLAGFSQIEALHDGAHDTRHSAGFPCH